jgi:hypothetical protein
MRRDVDGEQRAYNGMQYFGGLLEATIPTLASAYQRILGSTLSITVGNTAGIHILH